MGRAARSLGSARWVAGSRYCYQLRPTQGINYISPAVLEMLGWTVEDVYAHPDPLDMIHLEDRCLARKLLETTGYRVSAAASGEAAVAHVAERPVDLLILDMAMPPGIDGAETFRRVLEVRSGQRAIIVSGYPETEEVHKAQTLGAGSFLMKPVAREKLARAIRAELARPASRGGG